MSDDISVVVTTRDGEELKVTQSTGQQTLMQMLYEADVGVEAICGGCSSCATCHVFINAEWASKLPDRDQGELMLLQYTEHFDPERSRLSCAIQISNELDGMQMTIAPEE